MVKTIKRALLPFIFTMIVTVTITCGISLILSVEANRTEIINDNTYVVSLNQLEEETSFTNEQLLTWLQTQTMDFTFYKSAMSGSDKQSFSTEKDSFYYVGEGGAYINKWNEADQVIIDGRNYYYIADQQYEVKGYLTNFTNTIADLAVELKTAPDQSVSGIFYLDAGEKSLVLIEDLLKMVYKEDPTVNVTYERVTSNLGQSLLNQSFALLLFIGVSVLLLVSGFTVVFSWVEKHKRELFVRRLVGANEGSLLFRIYTKMLVIRLCGVVIGSLLTFIIINFFHILPYEPQFYVEAVYISIIIFLLLDLVFTLPMLFINQKRQLIKIMR